MKTSLIKAKSIIVKSNLPSSDYVINPYVDCMHACIYCYARFMKRFTGHKEPLASSPQSRIQTLQKMQKIKIATYVFIGPIMPYLTD